MANPVHSPAKRATNTAVTARNGPDVGILIDTTKGRRHRPGQDRVEPVPIWFECGYEYECHPGSLSPINPSPGQDQVEPVPGDTLCLL